MIDWKSRISDDDKYIDINGLPYYQIKFDDTCKTELMYEDIPVRIPVEPEDHLCVNYGLSEYDQIFRLNYRPGQVLNPQKNWGRDGWTEKEIDAFIDQEWNIRKNGIWFWIKGKKRYIPGQLWFKYNCWTPETTQAFEYRDHERKFFTYALQVQRDPIDLGISDFKCRQLGDTENSLVIIYERGSRIRGGLNTMQSFVNEEHVKRTYARLTHGHKNMVYWFKPMNTGTEDPKKGLTLDYPSQHITHAEIERRVAKGESMVRSAQDSYQHPPIGSKFVYGPSKVKHFDGATGVLTIYGDEFGKATENDPNEWVQTMAEAAYDSIRGRKRAFMLMTSTVEEITPECLEQAISLYKESNPAKRSSNGSTINRMVRIFRGVTCRGFENIVADRWGDIDEEKVIQAVTDKYNAYIQAGNMRGAMSFLRKNPRTIEDVFLSAANESQFHVENLKKREFYLTEVAHPKPWVRGNLKWKDGQMDTEVIWEPNPNGKWLISKHPEDFGLQKNYKVSNLVAPKPGNQYHFSMGVDPIEQEDTLDKDPSKGGIAVFKNLDELIDREESKRHQIADDIAGIQVGDPVAGGEYFETHRFVCTYCERPEDPNIFFEDVIMTAVYYGTAFLPEKNKFHAMHTYLKLRNYALYLMDKPTDVKNYRGQSEKDGVTATTNSIDMYFSFLQTFTVKWANTIDHPDLCAQLASMNWKNRGKRDLGVAAGWALYQSYQPRGKRKEPKPDAEPVRHFRENLV